MASDYACTGRDPVQALAMFRKKLTLHLSLFRMLFSSIFLISRCDEAEAGAREEPAEASLRSQGR